MDAVSDTLLTEFAVELIKRVSLKTKLDPDVLASAVPGLVHSHWYVAHPDERVDGCLYCARRATAVAAAVGVGGRPGSAVGARDDAQ